MSRSIQFESVSIEEVYQVAYLVKHGWELGWSDDTWYKKGAINIELNDWGEETARFESFTLQEAFDYERKEQEKAIKQQQDGIKEGKAEEKV